MRARPLLEERQDGRQDRMQGGADARGRGVPFAAGDEARHGTRAAAPRPPFPALDGPPSRSLRVPDTSAHRPDMPATWRVRDEFSVGRLRPCLSRADARTAWAAMPAHRPRWSAGR